MSADNWTTCPRCERDKVAAIKQREAAVQDLYGKVDVVTFDAKRAELEEFKAQTIGDTFREDYEFYGAEDGVVHVRYSGGCQTCKLTLTFEHEHPLDLDGAS